MKNSIRTAVIICFAFLGALPLRGQELSLEIPLWATPPTENNGLTGPETKVGSKGFTANVSYPVLKVYRADAARNTGTAVLIAPGGGYGALAMRQEGDPFAAWLAGQGITGVVLKYRMPNGHHEVPLSDAEQAIRLMRGHAKEWGVNPNRIGIMGASAGGHLAASLATLYSSDATRPDFQVLFYPVISMLKGVTHSGSRKNLLGETPSAELEQKYSLERQVSPQTPQTFIMLSADDAGVLPINGIGYFLALQEQKVPATLHVYPTGGHGWGFRDSFTYKRQWTGELEKWLREGLTFPEK